jgi:hypothetical protein
MILLNDFKWSLTKLVSLWGDKEKDLLRRIQMSMDQIKNAINTGVKVKVIPLQA